LKGKINFRNIPELFRDIFIKKNNGIGYFRRGVIKKQVFFKEGSPLFAASSDPNDRTGAIMLRFGRLSPEELNTALSESKMQKKKLGRYLVEKGKLSPDELVHLVIMQVEGIIFSIFEWEEGEYEFKEGGFSDDDIISLNMSASNVIMEGIRKKFILPRLKTIIGSPMIIFKITDDPKFRYSELQLKHDEVKILSAVDGKKNINDIYNETNSDPETLLKTLGALYLLNTLVVAGTKNDDSEPEWWHSEKEEKKTIKTEGDEKERAHKFYSVAKQFFNEGNFSKAKDFFEKAVELDPENSEYYTALGITYATEYEGHEPNIEAAVKSFKKAAELKPDDFRNYYYIGIIYKNIGKSEIALKAFKKAIELKPDYNPALEKIKELEKI